MVGVGSMGAGSVGGLGDGDGEVEGEVECVGEGLGGGECAWSGSGSGLRSFVWGEGDWSSSSTVWFDDIAGNVISFAAR